MDSKVVITISEEKKALFSQAITDIKTVLKKTEPIKSKDKQGGKIWDKALSLVPTAIENLPKVENYLPRDFDENIIKDNNKTMNLLLEYQKALDEQSQNISNICTLIRIELHTDYKLIYEAAQKAAAKDILLNSLRDELGEPYKKESADANKPQTADVK